MTEGGNPRYTQRPDGEQKNKSGTTAIRLQFFCMPPAHATARDRERKHWPAQQTSMVVGHTNRCTALPKSTSLTHSCCNGNPRSCSTSPFLCTCTGP